MSALPWLTARPIAHRGLHDRAAGIVENSRAAARAAIAGGFGIECDIQVSRDGEAMLFHDHELARLTGETGPVRDRPAAELGRIGLRDTDETIPTLAEFLDVVGGQVPLVIEVKSRFDGDESLARRLVEVLAGREGPIVAKSFDPAIVSLLRRIAPSLPRGIVAQSVYEGGEWDKLDGERKHAMANLLHWGDTRPDFVSWRHGDLPCAAPHLARLLAGVPVMTWTIRSQDEADRAAPHADQIVFEGFRPA